MSQQKLDLCFVCDTTGSMSGSIVTVQTHLKSIAEAICASEKRDLQLACVEYKDHCDPIVVDSVDFTGSVSKLKTSIDKWQATGGGDHAECIADGLHAASKLNWRTDSTKILVLCADAPPHGVGDSSDNHPNGCPLGLDPLKIVRDMITREIIIYTVGVNNPNTHTVSFLCTLSRLTGGRYLPLGQAESLPKILMGGAEEELELAKFEKQMEDEEKIVLAEAAKNKEELTEEQVHQRIATNLASKNVRTKKLNVEQHGGGAAWKAQEAELCKAESLTSYAAMSRAVDYADAPMYSSAPVGGGYGGGGGYGYADEAAAPAGAYGAPAPAPAPGFFGRLFSGFGSSPSPSPAAGPTPASPSYAAAPAPVAQKIELEEAAIDYEQVSRVMQKKAFRK